MLRNHRLTLLCASMLVVGCAVTEIAPTAFTPVYRPTDKNFTVPAASACAALSSVIVEDVRTQKELGLRKLESSGVTQPINFKGDPKTWIEYGAKQILQRANISTDTKGKPVLRLKINRIAVNESVNRRALYESRIDLTADVMAADGTKSCWTMTVKGTGENVGYAGSDLNYEETVNKALEQAMVDIVSNSDFSSKLCGACPK